MTTLARVDETLARFQGKSPRDSYRQVCDELHVHTQRDIYAMLPEKPAAWHHVYTLELDRSLLGTKGCMAILPIITASTSLRKLSLRSCGLSDEFVIALCSILQSHPSLRSVDISDNQLVTVYSAPHIISVMRHNPNMVLFDVYNTHVGANVGGIIATLGQRNLYNVTHYYQDRYFMMKNLFNYMDADGTGWVLLKSLVLNCPYPVLQEQFVERIAMAKPRKRSDGTISINAFLQLVYMNYKTEAEIGSYARKELDEPYIFLVSNWKQLMRATARYNVQVSEANARGEGPYRPVQLPEDLHRWRLRDFVLSHDDADALVEAMVQLFEHSAVMEEDGGAFKEIAAPEAAAAELDDPAGDKAAAEEDAFGTPAPADGPESDAQKPMVVPVSMLMRAAKSTLIPPASSVKPTYRFYVDRDATYVPEILRNGSRIFSIGRLSAVFGGSGGGANTGASGRASNAGESVISLDPAETGDARHTFSLPPSVVKMIVDFFNKEVGKVPKKKPSSVPDSPRTRRDKAMVKATIPVATFLSAEFVTDMERVCPRFLGDYYTRNALLIEDGTITLQEMVNVLDEMYVQCRIDRVMPLSEIEAMTDPTRDKTMSTVLTGHFAERDEDELSYAEPMEL